MMRPQLIAALMMSWLSGAGCASQHYQVISEDKVIRRMKAGQAMTPAVDGWFVPDARWIELNEAMGAAPENSK